MTRTYALWAGAGINTITHYRPKDSTVPLAHSGKLKHNFTMPTDYAGATCADPTEDGSDNGENNGEDNGENNGGVCDTQCELEKWADGYQLDDPKACYLDTLTVVPSDLAEEWKYLMYSGGCDYNGQPRSVDLKFEYHDDIWAKVLFSEHAEKTNLVSETPLAGGYTLRLFNLEKGAKDRVAFRVPTDGSLGTVEFKYTTVGVGP